MQHQHLRFGEGFRVVLGNRRSQAAQMTLAPGESTGDAHNRHRGADQWLYVISGVGLAIVDDDHLKLRDGTLLWIERGDRHEIRNVGRTPLKTLNFYVPPAYAPDGDELPPGRA